MQTREVVQRHRESLSMLRGRTPECAELDRLLLEARSGRSQVLVLRGDAGIGKTALLDYLAERASSFRVVRATGVESEMELTFAGLHQLCAPFLDRLASLPPPQASALATAFGLDAGDVPDRFIVGVAALSLLADAAEETPLVCIVDDAQWLDQASANVVGFVGRRLLAERMAVVCAARSGVGDEVLAEFRRLDVGGLGDSDARALLSESLHGPLDQAVFEQIIAETHGNPLALLELPRTWTTADLAGGFGLLESRPLATTIERSYAERLRQLPEETQLLVLIAAAEPLGDPAVLLTAVEQLGLDLTAADAAVDAGLLRVGARVEFSHPFVRSTAYRSASARDRHRVHQVLAAATDPARDPDRHAWHLAQATPGPDESVAVELERSAGRAHARGGVAAAAAFLRRSVALTTDPTRRAERALAAAQASLEAGAFDAALMVLATIEAGALDTYQRARSHLLRGRIASAASFGSAAAELLKTAKEIEPLDLDLARETYLDAWGAALAAGELAPAGTLREISRAALSARPRADASYSSDALLDGLALLVTEGLAGGTPRLREGVRAFRQDERVLQWGALAASAAAALWDMEGFDAVIARQVQLAREAGALALLATALQGAGIVTSWSGHFTEAASLIVEADAVTGATGVHISPYGGMLLAAYRGEETDAVNLMRATIDSAAASGEGLGVQYAHWTLSIVHNSLGHYDQALQSARQASAAVPELFVSDWALAELVEAAARTENAPLAAEAAERFVESTGPSESDWALGVGARLRALTTEGQAAEALYVDAISRLARTPVKPELARAYLLYGEWLRREGRRIDARAQLRTAHDMFSSIGMEAFAERARRELVGSGEKARRRGSETRDALTPQEEQIARLARDGLSNPEIGAQLFLSPRTVEWHLSHVFTKLGVRSRRELGAALPRTDGALVST